MMFLRRLWFGCWLGHVGDLLRGRDAEQRYVLRCSECGDEILILAGQHAKYRKDHGGTSLTEVDRVSVLVHTP